MSANNEEFQVLITHTRRIVSRWDSAREGWMMLGQAADAPGAEAIMDSWKNGTWTPRFG